MTPEVFAQTIVSIENTYGLRLDARSAWLRMDATPCGRGWVGTKPPGCKQVKKEKTTAQTANVPKVKPNQAENLKDKTEVQIAKIMTPSKKSTVPKKAEIPDGTKANEPTFESVADLKSLKKEWGADIAKAKLYIPISMLMGDDRRLEDHQKTVEALEPGEKKVLWMPGFPPETFEWDQRTMAKKTT